MKIIILGAGQVGTSVAENLAHEKNDIVVIDHNEAPLQALQSKLDIATVHGPGSRPDILAKAGASDADMLIAVTNNDETNMLACQVAYSLFHVPTKLARIRAGQYHVSDDLFKQDAIPVDFRINPESLITQQIKRLIQYPAALQVIDFARGQAQLVAIKPYYGGELLGKPLEEFYQHKATAQARIVAIYRDNQSIYLNPQTRIEMGDEVFFIAPRASILKVMATLRPIEKANKRIMIAGGGNVGLRLAKTLEDHYQVKLIESQATFAQKLADNLNNTLVLQGDAADKDLLLAENIEYMDTFCALTDDDETNIMTALLAKRLGARQVMAVVNRTPYIELIEGGPLDIAISPQQATIGSILTHLRQGDVVNVHSLRRGAAEVIEIIAHGDEKTSKVVGKQLTDFKLPKGATIAALIRDDEIIIHWDAETLQAGDQVVILVSDKQHIHQVEKLFQVSIGYFH